MIKFYERNIAEGKSFLIFAVLFAVVVRVVYYLHTHQTLIVVDEGGVLWNPLRSLFSNSLYSLLASAFTLIGIAIFINHVNRQYAFIRRRTLLPSAIVVLLFSCMPSELVMSPYYIAALCIIGIIGGLFEAYGTSHKQTSACKVTFYLALGSLFAPVLIVYLPLLWLCMARGGSLSFKSFFASLFTVVIIYVPVWSFFYFTNSLDDFLNPLLAIVESDWIALPILAYDVTQFVVLGALAVLYCMILVDNSINSFKSKIRVRAFSAVLTIIVFASFLFTILLNIDSSTTLFIGLAAGSLQIAHFFSLAEKKITKYAFFIYLLLLVSFSVLFFI